MMERLVAASREEALGLPKNAIDAFKTTESKLGNSDRLLRDGQVSQGNSIVVLQSFTKKVRMMSRYQRRTI